MSLDRPDRDSRGGPPKDVAAVVSRRSSSSIRATSTWVKDPRQGCTPKPSRSLSGNPIRRVALPRMHDQGDLLTFPAPREPPRVLPFAADVFPSTGSRTRRACSRRPGDEIPHQPPLQGTVSEGQPATRLSTAFDSVTLYGRDPDPRPDICSKVGTSRCLFIPSMT